MPPIRLLAGHVGGLAATVRIGRGDLTKTKNKAAGVSWSGSRGRLALGAAAYRMSQVLCWRPPARSCSPACNQDGRPGVSAAQPRGATVAFESIDGPPPGQFQKLVQNLNDEAQTRRLAVISRESPSAYRVRGYLAAKVVKGQTTIAWVWDVFDGDEHRAMRISGEETAKGRHARCLDRRRRRDVAADCPHQHGAARGLPDLAGGRAQCTPPARPASRSSRSIGARDYFARGRRHFPHFPHPCRSGADRDRGAADERRKCQPGAAAAPPASAARGGIGPGNAHTGGLEPLRAKAAFILPEKASGQRFRTRIAAPSPPCYDHAA